MGRDHSCEGCGMGGMNAEPGEPHCICAAALPDAIANLRSCDFTSNGCCDEDCHYCYSPFSATALDRLATNLAVAAQLRRAFMLGDRRGLQAAWDRSLGKDEDPHRMWCSNVEGREAPDLYATAGHAMPAAREGK